MVEGDGFEPSKAVPADLQSAPFGHSGTPPRKNPLITTAEDIVNWSRRWDLKDVYKRQAVTFQDSQEPYTLCATSFLQAENQVITAIKQMIPWLLLVLLLCSFFCAWLYSRAITRPILQLSDIAGKMADLDSVSYTHLDVYKRQDLTSEDPITVASSTECTGLVRTPAVTEAQAESYQDLYTVPVKENKQKDQIRP